MKTSNEIGAEFEEEVRDFLANTLGFEDVNGGPTFHIAPEGQKNQIDACGRHENVLFVFECKASGRQCTKNLRNEILETKSKFSMVLENYKKIPEYKNCTYVRFVFITKKISLPEANSLLFDKKLWNCDEGLVSYYSDLKDKIGEYATYDFLAEFEVTPHPNERVSIPAMKTKIGGYEVYNFYANPSELIKFSYVGRRRSLKEKFYQRMLDKHRIKSIQKYVSAGGVFPTNIILSLRGRDISFTGRDVKTHSVVETGELNIGGNYDACWIIDGQHRFYSLAMSHADQLVPCLAFKGINVETERSFFLDINKEQKPIPPDLVWDLEGLANSESYRGIISNGIRTLSKKEPFLGKIYIPINGDKTGKQINMSAFCNGVSNASLAKKEMPNCFGINPIYDENIPRMTKRISDVLSRFYVEIDEIVKEPHRSFIFGNAGIPISLYIFEPIVSYIGRTPSSADLRPYTEKIVEYFEEYYPTASDVKALKLKINSEGARKKLAQEVGVFIRRELHKKNFWPKLEENELLIEAIDMERRIGLLISSKLKDITSTWRKSRIQKHIYEKASEKVEAEGTRFDQNLGFGDEIQIITRTDNWDEVFQNIFIGEGNFQNIEEVKLAFQYISKIRNSSAHGKGTLHLEKTDIEQFNIYMQKLDILMPELLEDGT